MDSIAHLALEEICCEAANGLNLQNLWPKIGPSLASRGLPLCSNVKRVVWETLLEVPGLQFVTCEGVVSAEDMMKRSAEECENVKIVAADATRKCFLGIYDLEASEYSLSDTQRVILERLAVARTNGIAQNDLAKQLRIPANHIFYQLKKLETQGLIVRQPTVIRKKDASKNKELKYDSIVTTNMLYLYRYGKHLGCQQRLEIIKEDNISIDKGIVDGLTEAGDDLHEETAEGDVRVKDFLPALKAICDKLAKAEGKVLVVSDIKRDLGYRGTSGHRSWRNICRRLKDAQVVEECRTMVNKKELNCLRLLKSFLPSNFEPKFQGCGHNDNAMERSTNLVKRGQITEELVELPILRQVYDMIDAEGSKGLTNTEVCKKLGLCSKEYHKRIFSKMFSRFGLHLQAENHDRGVVYRVRTVGNFNPESSNMALIAKGSALQGGFEFNSQSANLDFHESSFQPGQVEDDLDSVGNVRGIDVNENIAEASNDTTVSGEGESMQLSLWNAQNSDAVPSNGVPGEELQLVSKSVTDNALRETCVPAVAIDRRSRSTRKYPCLTDCATSSQREQRILKMLQEEKFLIRPELHRRLMSLEKEKITVMDKKTLERCLKKLESEGLCKFIHVSVPVVTNIGNSRTTNVVLHPSVYNVSPELLGQIYDKMRSFEILVRRSSNFCQKKCQSIPMLDNVQRIANSVRLDVPSERAEVMRANGLVLAKMVRAKLLHIFLWDWIFSSPGWSDTFLSVNQAHDLKNPHSSYILFELEKAIKSIPLQLFLQVIGSAKKIEDMVEKCESDLKISDLSTQEYTCLVDTRATGRLSWLVDILRRLKLIRLVSKSHAEDGTSSSVHTTLTHALELKLYIEEPVSTIASSGFLFPDLRPQVRHDFVLSTRKTVEEYWNTLEYCYATAERRAALHAFPGSAVHEVFHSRSWASVRVMTAGQRDELLKCMAKSDSSKRLSFTECEKIAKDLNLNLEQVLRMHYEKRQQRFTRICKVLDTGGQENEPIKGKRNLSSRKRKQHSDRVPSKLVKASIVDCHSSVRMRYETGTSLESPQEPELNEKDGDTCTTICKSAFSRLKPRQRKFSWTEEADRQLVIEYARHRAMLGAKFHRVNWASISDLPAPPDSCRRRMSILKTFPCLRKAVMKLCTMLAERYAKCLDQFQDFMVNHGDTEMTVHDFAFEDSLCSSAPESRKWDDFDANNLKVALDDVLRYKRMAKLDAVKDVSSDQDYVEEETEDGDRGQSSGQRLSSSQLPKKYLKLSNKGTSVSTQMHESAAIANAAELFKLIFLSTSTAPEVSTLFAETLRRYSEHDLFAAFAYLKEKKIMIGGKFNSPFVLSNHFLHSISLSPFPMDTGKRAAKFASWIHERESDLMKVGVDVSSDLQCGEVLNLCARVSLGELSITPCVPDEGVGEAEDNRTSKRKCDSTELFGGDVSKKSKSSFTGEGEIISRREKGFPGIKLQLIHEIIPQLHVIEAFKDDTCASALFSAQNSGTMPSSVDIDCILSHSDVTDVRKFSNSEITIHPLVGVNESPWEEMAKYAENLMSSRSYSAQSLSLHPESFKTFYLAIKKSGDHGLGMKEIPLVLNIQDEEMEIMVEVLEAFGRALRVNAYDSIHVVDSLYHSKYFLVSPQNTYTRLRYQENKIQEHTPLDTDDPMNGGTGSVNEINVNNDEVHRVTILNLSEDCVDPFEIQCKDKITGHKSSDVFPPKMYKSTPLLPWMNGDGTINEFVYIGLVRRILGIVMQNPGILEDRIINQMHCLNPQSCRRLLEILILDNHLITRKVQQMTSGQPPSILGNLLGPCFTKSKLISRVHFFANPMSANLL